MEDNKIALPFWRTIDHLRNMFFQRSTGRNLYPHRPLNGDTPAQAIPAAPAGTYTHTSDLIHSVIYKIDL